MTAVFILGVGRGIHDHDVVLSVGAVCFEPFQDVGGVTGVAVGLVRIERDVIVRQSEGGFAEVHAVYPRRAARQCVHGKAAGVGKSIQDGFIARVTSQEPAVFPLVEEEARFLTAGHVNAEAASVFADGQRFDHGST